MKINYIDEGRGTALIFQHGLAADLNQIRKLLSGLPDIRLISMECPGHGQSPYPENGHPSFAYYTDELIRLLDRLQVEKAFLGGISMGSGISLQVALRFPERVRGLILVRPAWLDKASPDNLKILLMAAELMAAGQGQEQFEQLDSFRQINQSLPKAAQSVLGVFGESQQKELPMVLRDIVGDAPVAKLEIIQSIKKPSIILANQNDPLHPFEMAERLHQYLEGSSLHEVTSRYIDDDRHGKEVRNLILEFIKNHT